MHTAKTPDQGPPALEGAASPTTAAHILGDEEVADMVAEREGAADDVNLAELPPPPLEGIAP